MTTTYSNTVNPSVLEAIELAEATGARAAEMLTAIEAGTYTDNADIEEDIKEVDAIMPWDNIVTEFKVDVRDYLANLDTNLERLNALADETIASYPLL